MSCKDVDDDEKRRVAVKHGRSRGQEGERGWKPLGDSVEWDSNSSLYAVLLGCL